MRTEYEQLSSRIVTDETKQKKSLESLTLEVSKSQPVSVSQSSSQAVRLAGSDWVSHSATESISDSKSQ